MTTPTKLEEELRACPFCGGQPRRPTAYDERHLNSVLTWHIIKCGECGGRVEYPSRDGAIAKWNTRAADATLLDTIDALRKERDDFRRMCRDNYDAFSAMRNDVNERIGNMASQESTLMDGPEMAHECEAVVRAVITYAETAEALVAKLREGLGSPASLSIGDGIVTAAYARDEDASALFNILSWTPDAKEPSNVG